jgi:GNAT superfamily N-acetyltransferase
MSSFSIEENRLDSVMYLLDTIPELDTSPLLEDILARTGHVPHLILTAYDGKQPIGFKIGYERDGHFYSWLGGVLPAYRLRGIAALLADRQEEWAKNEGYTVIWMKTRNRFPEMLIMALRRGFRITSLDPREEMKEHRIVLKKSL